MELHPVILAAGRGSRMPDLTYSCPKALLPVANIPTICYPITILDKLGFEETIVVVPLEHSHDIQGAVIEHIETKMRLDFVTISESEGWGTADTLRFIKDKIKADLLVVSCDLITDVPIHRVIDLHRTHGASLTALLSSVSDHFTEVPPPGPKSKRKIERDIVGLDEGGERLLFFSSLADLDEEIRLRKSLLTQHPCVKMRSRLMDCHLYIMKKWILSYLASDKDISSIKGELLPRLIQKQFSKSGRRNLNCFVEENDLENMALEMSSWNDHHGDMVDCYHGDKVRCYTHVVQDKSYFCARVNNMSAYCEVNKQVIKYLPSLFPGKDFAAISQSVVKKGKCQIGNDCLLGTAVTVGDKASIKRSIIGPHCVIGERVKIINSVVMDHVTIGEGSTISGSVISNGAEIGEKNDIKDSIIGARKSTVALFLFLDALIKRLY